MERRASPVVQAASQMFSVAHIVRALAAASNRATLTRRDRFLTKRITITRPGRAHFDPATPQVPLFSDGHVADTGVASSLRLLACQ
jgi:hypothetical protein